MVSLGFSVPAELAHQNQRELPYLCSVGSKNIFQSRARQEPPHIQYQTPNFYPIKSGLTVKRWTTVINTGKASRVPKIGRVHLKSTVKRKRQIMGLHESPLSIFWSSLVERFDIFFNKSEYFDLSSKFSFAIFNAAKTMIFSCVILGGKLEASASNRATSLTRASAACCAPPTSESDVKV